MARYRETERETTKAEIRNRLLEAASREFSRAGYEGAGMDRISLAADLGKGTVYNYFTGKRALMEELLSDIAERHCAVLADAVRGENDPGAKLSAFFREGFAWIDANLRDARIMVSMLFGSDEGFRTHLRMLYSPFSALLAGYIEDGIKTGRYREVDPGKAAGLIMSVYLGTSVQISGNGSLALPPALVAGLFTAWLEKTSEQGEI